MSAHTTVFPVWQNFFEYKNKTYSKQNKWSWHKMKTKHLHIHFAFFPVLLLPAIICTSADDCTVNPHTATPTAKHIGWTCTDNDACRCYKTRFNKISMAYPKSACTWVIQANTEISFEFMYFDSLANEEYLQVYECTTDDCNSAGDNFLLHTFSGYYPDAVDGTFQAPNGHLKFVFTPSSYVVDPPSAGFDIWFSVHGFTNNQGELCSCKAGYGADLNDAGSCSACTANTYKEIVHTSSCLPCKENSEASDGAANREECR